MSQALSRIARAAIAAGLSTVSALGMHALAGGPVPHLAGVLVPLVLSFAIAIQLSGVQFTRWRVAVACLGGQVAFHFLFTLGATELGHVASSGPHAGHDPSSMHVVGGGAEHAAGMSHSMPLAHVAAAIFTYQVIRRGDVLLAWLASAAASLIDALLWRLRPIKNGIVVGHSAPSLPSLLAPVAEAHHWAHGGPRAPPAFA